MEEGTPPVDKLHSELTKLGLGALNNKAEAAGAASEAIEKALDAGDPKAALIALILAETNKAAALRAELEDLGLGGLSKRAAKAGLTAPKIEAMLDGKEPKQALIAIILELEIAAGEHAASALRTELEDLGLGSLKARATAEGVPAARVDSALDGQKPKEGLIALIIEYDTDTEERDSESAQLASTLSRTASEKAKDEEGLQRQRSANEHDMLVVDAERAQSWVDEQKGRALVGELKKAATEAKKVDEGDSAKLSTILTDLCGAIGQLLQSVPEIHAQMKSSLIRLFRSAGWDLVRNQPVTKDPLTCGSCTKMLVQAISVAKTSETSTGQQHDGPVDTSQFFVKCHFAREGEPAVIQGPGLHVGATLNTLLDNIKATFRSDDDDGAYTIGSYTLGTAIPAHFDLQLYSSAGIPILPDEDSGDTLAQLGLRSGSDVFAILIAVDPAQFQPKPIPIFVVPETGSEICLHVQPTDTIETVKVAVHDKTGLLPAVQVLRHEQVTLENEQGIGNYAIVKDSRLTLTRTPSDTPTILVSVDFRGTKKLTSFDLGKFEGKTVAQLKDDMHLDMMWGCPRVYQQLQMKQKPQDTAWKPLADSDILSSCGLCEGSLVRLKLEDEHWQLIIKHPLTGKPMVMPFAPWTTIAQLKSKVISETKLSIPTGCLDLKFGGSKLSNRLQCKDCNLQKDSELVSLINPRLSITSAERGGYLGNFFAGGSAQPLIQQPAMGMSMFMGTLLVVADRLRKLDDVVQNKILALLRGLSDNFAPLPHAFRGLLDKRNLHISEMRAICEGMYMIFRKLIPVSPDSVPRDVLVTDNFVYLYSRECWGYLISLASAEGDDALVIDGGGEQFKSVSMRCALSGNFLDDPVTYPMESGASSKVCNRAEVVKRLQAGDLTQAAADLSPGDLVDANDIGCLSCSVAQLKHEEVVKVWAGKDQKHSAIVLPDELTWQTMVDARESLPYLAILPALNMKNSSVVKPALTLDAVGHVVVFVDRGKDVGLSCILYVPLTGNEKFSVDPDALAVQQEKAHEGTGLLGSAIKVERTMECQEAIIVLLDTSSSMRCSRVFPTQAAEFPGRGTSLQACSSACHTNNCDCPGSAKAMTRLDTVKQFFHAFSNRSQAYSYPHNIGLIKFGSFEDAPTFECEITELFDTFKAEVDEAEGRGKTHLWDGMLAAHEKLKLFRAGNPEARLRILVLSDGADTGKKGTTAYKVARLMQSEEIVVDSIVVGEDQQLLDEMEQRRQDANAITGKITCSLKWNGHDDLDLHCITPSGKEISFANKEADRGRLDVDRNASGSDLTDKPVENIFFCEEPTSEEPMHGHYKFFVRNYYSRTGSAKTPCEVRLRCGPNVKDMSFTDVVPGKDQTAFEFDWNGDSGGATGATGAASGQFMDLKSVCHATGGCCFRPLSVDDALRLFERETVLSLRAREELPVLRPVRTEADLAELASLDKYPFDEAPKPLRPEQMKDGQCISAREAIRKEAAADAAAPAADAAAPKPGASTRIGAATSQRARSKRVVHELRQLARDPHPSFTIFPDEQDVGFWKMLMVGPQGTPYEGGTFMLFARFPDNYPNEAPEMRFVTQMYHCNVNPEGRICHSIFDRNYSQNTSIRLILNCVYGLMLTPEPEDPLDSRLAEQFYNSREAYETNAKANTQQHASRSLDDMITELLTAVATD